MTDSDNRFQLKPTHISTRSMPSTCHVILLRSKQSDRRNSICGGFDSECTRRPFGKTSPAGQGSPWHLEIEREMGTSVKKAVSRMQHQSAVIRNRPKETPVNQTFNVHGPNARVNIDSTDNSTNIVNQGIRFRNCGRQSNRASQMESSGRQSLRDLRTLRWRPIENQGRRDTGHSLLPRTITWHSSGRTCLLWVIGCIACWGPAK